MNRAREIIEACVAQGVRHFCLGVGARGTSLVVALGEIKGVMSHIHFDERGVGFLALGLAKATGEAVGIITTSGSAVGNLLPAVMEGDADGVPLVLVTADRPFELRGCGANQACDQVKVFSSFVREQIDLPCDGSGIGGAVAHCVFVARDRKGPVHINCQMREPFLPLGKRHERTPIKYGVSSKSMECPSDLLSCEKGVIVAGSGAASETIVAVAEKLKWPLIADCLSGIRTRSSITHYNHFELPEAECVLHFGDRLVSKKLLEWLERTKPKIYGMIAAHSVRHDPVHGLTHRMCCEPEMFCKELVKNLPQREGSEWLEEWKEKSAWAGGQIEAFFQEERCLTEPGLFHFLQEALPQEWSLFVGNSMPIRDADSFFFPSVPQGCFMANRGVSGIDGNSATLVGLSLGRDAPLLGVIGDLTALHDLNSLALLRQTTRPIVLIVINNGGGGIFSFLPIAKQTELFESHFAAAHELKFEQAARLFDIPYTHVKTRGGLEETLLELFQRPRTTLIEMATDRVDNYNVHQTIEKICRQNSSSYTDSWDAKKTGTVSLTT